MVRKALILYISGFLFALVLSGCILCKCNPQHFHFRWTDMTLGSGSYVIQDSIVIGQADTGADFSARNYLLLVNLDGELLAANQGRTPGLLNQAYACSCAEDTYESGSAVSALRVYTVNAYDATHPAGAEVTGYFLSPLYEPGPKGLGPLDLGIPSGRYHYAAGAYYALYLETRPSLPGRHQFRVVVDFSDGSSFTALTPELSF